MLHLEIDNDGRLRTKLYDKRDEFHFPIVNFPFICSNIPAAYMEYISLYWSDIPGLCPYHDFFDRGVLLTRRQLNQGFIELKLKSLLYGHHRDLVNHYRISVINDQWYVLFVVMTIRPFPHSWLITGFVPRVTRTSNPFGVPWFAPPCFIQVLVGFVFSNYMSSPF
jgi:hypothetical protein